MEIETRPFENFNSARDAARAVVKDKMPGENPFEALTDLWLAGYFVYFDGNKLIAAYVEVKKEEGKDGNGAA